MPNVRRVDSIIALPTFRRAFLEYSDALQTLPTPTYS